ncbi:MAG: MnhB domain-containing protein, partial [Aggregatilineales bacterium]
RGMDTVVEIAVFITAAIGVLTLLSRGQERRNPLIPVDAYTYDEKVENTRTVTSLQTPFTRMVARLVLPLTFMIALVHLLQGGGAPGDGFTAGAITGLVVALWFVIFGYEATKAELTIVAPYRLMRAGLLIVTINALIPMLSGGTFAEYLNYGKSLGIVEMLDIFHLKLTSTLVFEIGVAIAVFGGATAIMETIAYPTQNTLEDDL